MKRALTSVALAIALPLAFWAMFLNHVDQYEAGIAWNFATGDMWQQEAGFHLTMPWVLVTDVDTRPQRVCITSAGHAAFNCKLVQFRPAAWREFIRVEGWRYYWFANRLSLNVGYREEYRGFRDILRGYAFSAERYQFIDVLEDYEK